MGTSFTKMSNKNKSSWHSKLFDPNDIQISLIGLDDGGNHALLSTLKPDDAEIKYQYVSGFVEQLAIPQENDIKLNVMSWTFGGGRDSTRPLWGHFFQYTDGLIFLVDSSDREMLDYIKDQIDSVLEMDVLDGKPMLFVANKQDLPTACSLDEITEKLGIHSIKNRECYICTIVATERDGIKEGMDWLSAAIQRKNPRKYIKPETKEKKPAKPAGLGYIKNSVVSLKNVFCGKGA